MRIQTQDFRYLLAHLVPQHRLSSGLRRDVDQALRTGGPRELRWQSVRALEALCDAAYFERAGVTRDNGNVIVEYRRPLGNYQVSVALPHAEWEQVSGGDAAHGDALAAIAPDVAAGTVGAPDETRASSAPSPARADAVQLLPEIARSFTISDQSVPVLERVDILLATLERWLGFTSGRLDVLEDTLVAVGDQGGARVRIVADSELRASELVRRAIESGTRRLITAAHTGDAANGQSSGTIGVAPIFALGKVVGALRVHFPPTTDRATLDARLDAAAGVVRNVIELNHQFESLTSIDSLTRVYNRQFFDRQLPVEIERAMRSGSPLTMLVLDVDNFKGVNDELGHRKGDEALVAIADIIRRNLRKVDMPFRYGGEEIVILLPGTPELEALHTAERLRRVINQYRGFRDTHGQTRDLSVSIGVAVYPDTAKSGEQLFAQADEAMYRAKKRGKNQVVLFSSA